MSYVFGRREPSTEATYAVCFSCFFPPRDLARDQLVRAAELRTRGIATLWPSILVLLRHSPETKENHGKGTFLKLPDKGIESETRCLRDVNVLSQSLHIRSLSTRPRYPLDHPVECSMRSLKALLAIMSGLCNIRRKYLGREIDFSCR